MTQHKSVEAGLSAAEQSDGWIEWAGGECAPADWDGEGVKFRLGTYAPGTDGSYDWRHGRYPEDIVAYRLVKP